MDSFPFRIRSLLAAMRLVNIRLVLSFLFLQQLPFSAVRAQGLPVAIGNWRDHTPFVKVIGLCEVGNKIYCASTYGLFSYSRDDGSLNTFTRLTGLSDFELAGIKYDPVTGLLLISYENSNIDLMRVSDHTIINIPDLKRQNIVGGKRINDVVFINRKAYLATDFGIVVLDLDRHEIKDTYYIGPGGSSLGVLGIAFNGTELLAATIKGIYTATLNDPNIFNYTGWSKETAGLSNSNEKYSSATSFNGQFYAVMAKEGNPTDTVLVRSNGTWQIFGNDFGTTAKVDSANGHLIHKNYFKIWNDLLKE